MRNTIILFSGGIDSLAMLSLAIKQNIHPILLHIEYEHPAAKEELNAVKNIHSRFADRCKLYLHKAAIYSEAMKIGIGKEGPRVVTGRNLMFLSIAYNLSKYFFNEEYFYTWIGASKADQKDYFDCSSNFIHIAQLLTPKMGLYAPLIMLNKKEIVELVDPSIRSLAWSCYEPKKNNQCGECNSCRQYNGISI
jgi:7-cyano-7-deazaguanine synthase in queuosine biosynthesis